LSGEKLDSSARSTTDEAHFSQLAASNQSGDFRRGACGFRHRLSAELMSRRIGVETMDTLAAAAPQPLVRSSGHGRGAVETPTSAWVIGVARDMRLP
jgi:hypothetical protein